MTLSDWATDARESIRKHGLAEGSRLAGKNLFSSATRRVGRRVTYGTPYWDRDWDVLIVLDSCRYDLMKAVADGWDFLPSAENLESTFSPGSMSEEFLERHVTDQYRSEIERTALISANVFTSRDWVSDAGWAHLDNVWMHDWDDTHNTVLPRPVTDAAIDHWRSRESADRMIVWYLQPHAPFVRENWSHGLARSKFGNRDEERDAPGVWRRCRDGEISRDQLWEGYRRNLEYVLEDVSLLLENLDAERVVISSDHGNGIGEWGAWGHPKHSLIPAIKRVPWAETRASDEGTHTPDTPTQARGDGMDGEVISERLAALGYVDEEG